MCKSGKINTCDGDVGGRRGFRVFSVVRWLLLAAEGGVQRALRSSAGQRAAQRGTHTLCFCFLESAPSVRFQVLALEPDPVGSSCTA